MGIHLRGGHLLEVSVLMGHVLSLDVDTVALTGHVGGFYFGHLLGPHGDMLHDWLGMCRFFYINNKCK